VVAAAVAEEGEAWAEVLAEEVVHGVVAGVLEATLAVVAEVEVVAIGVVTAEVVLEATGTTWAVGVAETKATTTPEVGAAAVAAGTTGRVDHGTTRTAGVAAIKAVGPTITIVVETVIGVGRQMMGVLAAVINRITAEEQ